MVASARVAAPAGGLREAWGVAILADVKPLDLVVIGCGAIGSAVLERLRAVPAVRLVGIVARAPGHPAAVSALRRLGLDLPVVGAIEALDVRPGLCLECAGHAALADHVVRALRGGIPCIATSVGALAADAMAERLEAAAGAGGVRLELIAGAIGAIDALAAAREGGLDEVVYCGRKPPASWAGTAAEGRRPLPGNPKSSALTAWSAVRAVLNHARGIAI